MIHGHQHAQCKCPWTFLHGFKSYLFALCSFPTCNIPDPEHNRRLPWWAVWLNTNIALFFNWNLPCQLYGHKSGSVTCVNTTSVSQIQHILNTDQFSSNTIQTRHFDQYPLMFCQTSGRHFHALCAMSPTSLLCTTKMAVEICFSHICFKFESFNILKLMSDFTQTNFVVPSVKVQWRGWNTKCQVAAWQVRQASVRYQFWLDLSDRQITKLRKWPKSVQLSNLQWCCIALLYSSLR